MEPNIEVRLMNYKLRILSIHKKSIYNLMYPLIRIAFTGRTKSSFFSFSETNDDYSIIVDSHGFNGIFTNLKFSI